MRRTELTQRGEMTRERVLLSAARVLFASGYASATLNQIAKEADTQAGSLYHYFDSRESLIREVMTRGITETLQHVEAALDAVPAEGSSRDRLAAVMKAHVEYILSGSDIARASIRALGQAPEEVEGPSIELHRAYGRILAGLISDAARDGYLPPSIDQRLLRLLMVGAANWTTSWFDANGASSAAEVGEALVLMVFGAKQTGDSQTVAFGPLHARGRRSTSVPGQRQK